MMKDKDKNTVVLSSEDGKPLFLLIPFEAYKETSRELFEARKENQRLREAINQALKWCDDYERIAEKTKAAGFREIYDATVNVANGMRVALGDFKDREGG